MGVGEGGGSDWGGKDGGHEGGDGGHPGPPRIREQDGMTVDDIGERTQRWRGAPTASKARCSLTNYCSCMKCLYM